MNREINAETSAKFSTAISPDIGVGVQLMINVDCVDRRERLFFRNATERYEQAQTIDAARERNL